MGTMTAMEFGALVIFDDPLPSSKPFRAVRSHDPHDEEMLVLPLPPPSEKREGKEGDYSPSSVKRPCRKTRNRSHDEASASFIGPVYKVLDQSAQEGRDKT